MFTPRKRGAKIAKWLADQKMREKESLIAEAMLNTAARGRALPFPASTGNEFNAISPSFGSRRQAAPASWSSPSTGGPRRYFNTQSAASNSSGGGERSTTSSGDAEGGAFRIIGINGAGGKDAGGNPKFQEIVVGAGGEIMSEGGARNAIDSFLTDHRDGQLIILGYSRGGNAAIDIANDLGKDRISVNLLVTIDPHRFKTGGGFDLKYGNVKRAVNYYQKNPTTSAIPGLPLPTGQNPYKGEVVNGATNYDYTGTDATHLNLPSKVAGQVASEVRSAVSVNQRNSSDSQPRLDPDCAGSQCWLY